MPVSRDQFRHIAGSFPTGVVVVATLDEHGTPRGLLTQTFVAVSTEPPLVLVSIDKSSRTLAPLQRQRKFVVNFLKQGSEDVATRFASKDDDKFHGIPWVPSPVAGGSPILREASTAYAECVVTQAIEAGDHWIFIASLEGGEVLGGAPLMYFRRTYAAWPEERPAPKVEGAAT